LYNASSFLDGPMLLYCVPNILILPWTQ
jgi:hypothetical protein